LNCRVKIAACLVVLTLAAACAHAPRPQVQGRETTLPCDERDVRVAIRYERGDDEVAQQVRRALDVAVRLAERWGPLPASITITIHPTHEALEVAARRGGYAWLRAWARRDTVELQSPRSWSRGAATDAELAELLTHELTHCAMYQALGHEAGRVHRVPIWFREGMATTNAGEHLAAVTGPAAGDALTTAAVLYRTESPLVYATADRAFRFLVRRYGEERVRRVLERVRSGAEFGEAFEAVMGVAIATFEDEFRSQLARERAQG
jgi:hypothetical protein